MISENKLVRFSRVTRALPYIELAGAVAAAGLWYVQGGAVWYTGTWPGAWPVALLIIPALVRLVVVGSTGRPRVFDLLLWIFLASALLGVWAAYDPGPAWAKFWLIVGAVGLYTAIVRQPDIRHFNITLALFGLFGVGFSLYFLATNDWTAASIKIPFLVTLVGQISTWLPSLAGHPINPNVVGGMLAMLMPVYVPLMILSRRSSHLFRRRWLLAAWSAAACIAGITLLLSVSRGAWLALASIASVWALWHGWGGWVRRRKLPVERARRTRRWLMTASLAVGLGVLSIGLYLILLGRLPGAGELINRLDLLRDSLRLARDYPFTGAGLGMFEMQFSIYTLLIHVGYIVHSHNILANVLIEQGLIGLLSFVGLVVACGVYGLRRLREATGQAAWIIEAGLASLGVILVHGLVDDALYGSRGVLLLFVPIGWILCGANNTRLERPITPLTGRRRRLGFGLAVASLVVMGLTAWRPVLGEWYANLGAIEQARVELSHYDQTHFDNPTMDQVRQRENLDAAGTWLRQAVMIDPANATARQRLTEIELAHGQYAEALQDIQFIYRAGEQDAVTRMLLGDAYVANGQVQAAAAVTQGLPWAIARLEGQAWSRYWVNADYRRAADAWAAIVLLDPGNTQAVQSQAEAARRAAQK